ncbi:CRISPR system precrRNA processing endoribonuclease RAMP protein Cas6 [Lamprobacter modestohalophilus]|nr:CRISPR system precrRNA processing endoribonuclease RAMP protein Cas6 [Lamprobacter modestohalophilus]
MITALPIELIRYRLIFETLDPLSLPDYPGSAWRGAFGHALKASACTQAHGQCNACTDRPGCPYPPLFDAEDEAAAVRPFVFEPHASSGYFPPGVPLSLDMVVFGWLNQWLPLLLDSFQALATQGLGQTQRARLRLVEVRAQTDAHHDRWHALTGFEQLRFGSLESCYPPLTLAPIAIPAPPSSAVLDFITPLRLKFRGRLVKADAFGARDLLITLARRMEACATLLESLPRPPAPEHWLAEADSLITQAQLAWRDTSHYSNRQREAMKLGGITGTLRLQGPVLERIWPWLWLGQWLHLGASSTIGLGQYRLR